MDNNVLTAGSNVAKTKTRPAAVCLFRFQPALKAAIVAAAKKEKADANELVARIVASHFGKPELAPIPKKRSGRPPGKSRTRGAVPSA